MTPRAIQQGEWEMYDLDQDPHELNNVYGKPKYAELQAKLCSELGRLREQLQVPPNESEE